MSLQITDQEYDNYIIDFLNRELGADIEIVPLAGDASARRYCRVVRGDESFVLMIWEPFVDNENYPFLSVLRHLEKHNVKVPQVISICAEKGLILLEDLGDLTLERKFWENQNQEHVLPFYKQAIDELIKIHYPCTSDHSSCTAFNIKFDTAKLLWEMNYGREHLIERFCQIKLTPGESTELDLVFNDICQKLDQEPKFICHRDYHSRNLMIKLGQMRVIDFQDARMGPIQYDLVSLVHDSYVELSHESVENILEYYFEQTKKIDGTIIDQDHFHNIFHLQMIQRCFKACGSFSSFYNLRGDKRYLKYLHKTINKVAACLGSLPKYEVFLNILESKGLLEREYSLESLEA